MKPGILCKLYHGRAIAAFKGFVDTFNWLVDFCNNLKGADGIKIDTKDPDHPVIRIDKEVVVGDISDKGVLDVNVAGLMQRKKTKPDDPEILVKVPLEDGSFELHRLPIGILDGGGGGGGGGKFKVTGTDGVTVEGSSLVFASEDNSNVTVKATVDVDGVITCKIGVYWKR